MFLPSKTSCRSDGLYTACYSEQQIIRSRRTYLLLSVKEKTIIRISSSSRTSRQEDEEDKFGQMATFFFARLYTH